MVRRVVSAVDIDPKTGSTLGFYTYGDDRPNVFVLAAMEGCSATSVYASYLLMKYLDNLDRLVGTVTVLPVANPLAFRLGVRVSPLDSKDLDTVFPGDERGTISDRTAWEIWRRTSQADYVIHLRTASQQCVSHITGLHRDYIHVRNLASQIALPLVVQSSGQRGALITEAAHEGIPAVSIGMRGSSDEIDTQAAVEVREALLNLLRIKNMIIGDSIDISSVHTGRMQHVNVEYEGFFTPLSNVGEFVKAGDLLGRVQDSHDVLSLYDGALISLSRMQYVFEGDMIARIAPPVGGIHSYNDVDDDTLSRRTW